MSISSQAVSVIYYGPMKSGKSRYLVEIAEQLSQQGRSFLAFKPLQDTRDGCWIRSRDPQCRSVQALGIHSAQNLQDLLTQAQAQPEAFAQTLPLSTSLGLSLSESFVPKQSLQACLIDEVFLLGQAVLPLITWCKQQGISLYLSGLDRDFRAEFFPLGDATMQDLIEACDEQYPLKADCEMCGKEATLTQRLIAGQPAPYDSPTVLIGDEEYQARCEAHHVVLSRPQLIAS